MPDASTDRADVVVVGGGTVGGWCAAFLAMSGAGRVILIERSLLGRGASSRAAGMVRAQGGTQIAVTLGMWSIDFYRRQHEEFGVDSGFVEQGYFMPAFNDKEIADGRERVAMQRSLGLDVEWLEAGDAETLNPQMAPGICLGGSFAGGDGYIDPPRNVLAYALVLARSGVEVREGVCFLGLNTSAGRVTGIETTTGVIHAERVVLTGGPDLAAVGRLAGISIPSGGARHQVAVTAPCPELNPESDPMVFDVGAGLYWRPEDGGLLFGMSNPEELPGVAHSVDWGYLEHMRERLGEIFPRTRGLALRRVWAATIDFTPDHLPIIGEAPETRSASAVQGVVVASAGGHGMVWGPAVARAAADLSLHGSTELVDVTDLGLERFDEQGRSRLAPDPIALPFPESAHE